MCAHFPPCASAHDSVRCCSARVVADHPVQGWRLLCNGIALFDDGYYLGPDGMSARIPESEAAISGRG